MKTVDVKTGLTGYEKKLAKIFGGVVATQNDNKTDWTASFHEGDVYIPEYGGSIRAVKLTGEGHTAIKAAQELLRITKITDEQGRLFYVGSKGAVKEYNPSIETLAASRFKPRGRIIG